MSERETRKAKDMQTTTTQDAIAAAYLELSAKDQDWVRLAKLRPLVQANRADVDAELLALARTGLVHLAPDSNRKALTDTDHAAAIRVGSQDKHLIAIENDYFED